MWHPCVTADVTPLNFNPWIQTALYIKKRPKSNAKSAYYCKESKRGLQAKSSANRCEDARASDLFRAKNVSQRSELLVCFPWSWVVGLLCSGILPFLSREPKGSLGKFPWESESYEFLLPIRWSKGALIWPVTNKATSAPASRRCSRYNVSHAHIVACACTAGGPNSCSRWLLQIGPTATCAIPNLLL
jgi:hypothetical protein